MALHRDIYWVGRQWAVTGYGMQLIDQKLKGYFDIEASRLWEDGLVESMQERPWLNAGDFDKALSIARARYKEPPKPEPPYQAAPPEPAASSVQEGAASEPPKPEPPIPELPRPTAAPELSVLRLIDSVLTEPPIPEPGKVEPPGLEPPKPEPAKPAPPQFAMQANNWPARFVSPWRVRIRY